MWQTPTYKLREKSRDELLSELQTYKVELEQLRVQRVSQTSTNKIFRMRQVKKYIARILTVINQQRMQNLKKFFKGKHFKPLCVRPKKTRAKRRELTKHQKSLVTLKEQKRRMNFPMRKYALKQD